jgi:hypothetical protein
MNEQIFLEGQVRQWEAEGRWVDRGRWARLPRHSEWIYIPTRREIRAKCKLFRSLSGWRGANKRAPRGGEFGLATTAGI